MTINFQDCRLLLLRILVTSPNIQLSVFHRHVHAGAFFTVRNVATNVDCNISNYQKISCTFWMNHTHSYFKLQSGQEVAHSQFVIRFKSSVVDNLQDFLSSSKNVEASFCSAACVMLWRWHSVMYWSMRA